jgi:hypothetical protein
MKSHKKAFGFSWISLSESSLFKGLRQPLGPKILCCPPQPLGRRRAPPPRRPRAPLRHFSFSAALAASSRAKIRPRRNTRACAVSRCASAAALSSTMPASLGCRLAASSDRKKHHSVEQEKRKEKSRIFAPAVLGLEAPAAPRGDRSVMAWRRLCARGF